MEVLYLFNPENDMALACGDPYYMAPAGVRRMAAELSALPAWYAETGASVLVDARRCAMIAEEPFPVPLAVKWVTEISSIYNKVCPWGWNPSLVHRLQEAGVLAGAFPSAGQMDGIRRLSGRQTAVAVLRSLRCTLPAFTVGEAFVLHSGEEVEKFVLSHAKALLKAPWSGSGRGIQHVSGAFPAPLKGWVGHILTTQGAVVGEPFYERVLDFAMEFFSDVSGGGIRFVGYSLFETDKRGSYKENVLAADAEIESRLAAYVPVEALHLLRDGLLMELRNVIKEDYEGYLGVDMMICRNVGQGEGNYSVHPCVEINLRMNMGVVARLLYDRYVGSGAQGRYVIEYYRNSGEAAQVHRRLRQQYPLLLVEGEIKSGYLSLTPVAEDTAYQAYIIVR